MLRSLSTSEFAKALGISDSSVRRLADAGELEIQRTRGGHRRIPVAEAVRYVRASGVSVERPELLGLAIYHAEVHSDDVNEQMLAVLEGGKASSVIGLMQTLYAGGMSIDALCDGPILYAMQRIGERWPADKKAIFIEHRATVLCARSLNQLRLSIPEPDEDAPEAIGAAMQGDVYLLPTLMTSLVLHEAGFNETNLGPNTPLDVLADAIEDEQPELTWLCIAEPIRSRTQQYEIEKLALAASHHGSQLVIGGRCAADLQVSTEVLWTICKTMGDLKRLVLASLPA